MIGRDAPNLRGWKQAADGTWHPPPRAGPGPPEPPPSRRWPLLLAGLPLVAVAAFAVVTAAGRNPSETPRAATTTPGLVGTTSAASPPTTGGDLPVGARARLQSGATVQVRSYERGVAAESASPAAGRQFHAIEVEGCAPAQAADDGSIVNPFRFVLRLPDGTSIHHGVAVREPAIGVVSLGPSECARGWITFEVSRNVQPAVVAYASPAADTAQWRLSG